MTLTDVIQIERLASELTTAWQPLDLVQVNGSVLRLVRLDGRFNWHRHAEDELFIGWKGTFTIELEGDRSSTMGPGDCYLVPAGVEHRPVAGTPAYALLLVEPQTRHNFGVAGPE